MSHPSRAALERFLSGVVVPSDDAIVRHMMAECVECSEVIASAWTADLGADEDCWEAGMRSVSAIDEGCYDEVVQRTLERFKCLEARAATERREASRLLPRLLRQPLERQLMLVGNSRQYATAAMCELLLEDAFERRYDDPSSYEALAHVSMKVSLRLDGERYGDALVQDIQGRCWAHVANARRILGDFVGTEQALRDARSSLAEGTGSPLDEALCWEVEAALRSTRADLAGAVQCVGRAIALYRRIGDRHLLGRALIQQGMVWVYAEDFTRAVVLTRAGLGLIEFERDDRVALAGWHNLCLALHKAGEDRQALAALTRARPAYLRVGTRAGLLRFQWLEGMIAASLQRDEQAEGCLREAREGFIQLGVALDAAEVSLDLAGLLLHQGRTSEVRELAVEMVAIFEGLGTRQEALAAFILLRQAAERDRVTEALLQQLGARLREPQARG